jgi:hypothetical protein
MSTKYTRSAGTPAAFAGLVEALARELGVTLDASEERIEIFDTTRSLWLAVELCGEEDAVCISHPFMRIPAAQAQAQALAATLLALNADRSALAGAVVASDVARQWFNVNRVLPLEVAPAEFLRRLRELVELGEFVRRAVEEEEVGDDAALAPSVERMQ